MRIMVDSNTLISGIVFEGIERNLLRRIWQIGHTLVIAKYSLTEVDRVINSKFSGSSKTLSILNAEIFPLPESFSEECHVNLSTSGPVHFDTERECRWRVAAFFLTLGMNLFIAWDRMLFGSGSTSTEKRVRFFHLIFLFSRSTLNAHQNHEIQITVRSSMTSGMRTKEQYSLRVVLPKDTSQKVPESFFNTFVHGILSFDHSVTAQLLKTPNSKLTFHFRNDPITMIIKRARVKRYSLRHQMEIDHCIM